MLHFKGKSVILAIAKEMDFERMCESLWKTI